jgi:lipoate-protein ligase A
MPDPRLRVIPDDGTRDPTRNLAVEEALARVIDGEPVLRLWRDEPCVVLGRFQVAEAEVDMAAAARTGVPVYRRFTGGGAVYHDRGNLNVTVVARRDDPLVADRLDQGLAGLYGVVLGPLVTAVRASGLPAVAGARGLGVGGRKLGGVAAWAGRFAVLVHATVLIDTDLATLARILAGPGAPGDRRWQLTRSVRVPVTSLACELRREGPAADPGTDRVGPVIERDIVRAFGAGADGRGRRTLIEEGLRATELVAAADLLERRYGRPAWHAVGRPA